MLVGAVGELAVVCVKVAPAEKAPCKMASASTKSNVAVVESPWIVGSKSSSKGLEGEVMLCIVKPEGRICFLWWTNICL